jgi:hypothetical protein
MAYEIPGFSFPMVAAVAMDGSQFRAVNVDAAGKAALPALGGRIIGIRQNQAKINEAVTVMHNGISFVEAGAAIAVGANVAVDATGRAITAVAGQEIIGTALEAASGVGIRIAVLLGTAGRAA